MPSQDQEIDWEISEEGLYIATRSFLTRRGYCCANRCRNCPYINWEQQATWQPAAAECIKRIHVAPKAIAGACALLYIHEKQIRQATPMQQEYHRAMIEHYRLLLERWER
jgi:hypothetical protein